MYVFVVCFASPSQACTLFLEHLTFQPKTGGLCQQMAPKRRRRSHHGPEPELETNLASQIAPQAELEELRAFKCALMRPTQTAGAVFDMQTPGDKVLLSQAIWLGGYNDSMVCLREANPELVEVINAQTKSQYDADPDRHARLVNGVLLNIVRAQNQFKVPLVTAAFTILSDVQGVKHTFHEVIRRNFSGALMTNNWGDGFLELARANRPASDDEMLEGVQVGVFDNLSMKLNYGSYVTQEAGGELKHMTNWLVAEIPRKLATPGFSADYICELPPSLSIKTLTLTLALTFIAFDPYSNPDPDQLRAAFSGRTARRATLRASSTWTRPRWRPTVRAGGGTSSSRTRVAGCSSDHAWRLRGCRTRSTCRPCTTGCSPSTRTCATR